MNLLDFALMTLFNAAVCIILPKVIAFDWSSFTNDLNKEIDNQGKIASDRVA